MENETILIPTKPEGTYIEGRLIIDGNFFLATLILIVMSVGLRIVYKSLT